MKLIMLRSIVMALFFSTALALAQDRLNPPFPRTASYSLGQGFWPTYSIGSRLEILSRYDMAYIYGSDEDHGMIKAIKLRQLRPDQILIAMGLNGVYFSDPPEYYLYRPYRGYLTENVSPGQRTFVVDNVDGIIQGLDGDYRFCYVVINNDVINIEYAIDDTLVAPNEGDDFWKVNQYHNIGDSVMSVIRLPGPGVFPNFSEWCLNVDGKYV